MIESMSAKVIPNVQPINLMLYAAFLKDDFDANLQQFLVTLQRKHRFSILQMSLQPWNYDYWFPDLPDYPRSAHSIVVGPLYIAGRGGTNFAEQIEVETRKPFPPAKELKNFGRLHQGWHLESLYGHIF